MIISEGIKLQGSPAEIPDCSRDDLPQFFVDMGYKVGAEIGVYKGEYTDKFCRAGLKIYAIDPWKAYGDYDKKNQKLQERQDFLYGHTQRVLAKYPDCTIIRKTSMNAVEDFKDDSLDFVYIDGHHGFKYVAEDIWEWSKKVRKGGVISGHDYAKLKTEKAPNDPYTCHVKYVVDAYTQACGISDWYVLGRQRLAEGERGDQWRSWMWIKE